MTRELQVISARLCVVEHGAICAHCQSKDFALFKAEPLPDTSRGNRFHHLCVVCGHVKIVEKTQQEQLPRPIVDEALATKARS